MPKKRAELTETEWAIIKAVWKEEPCTAPQIQQKLQKQTGWAYSTVRTLMDRMAAKGILSTNKERNVTVYCSAITRSQAQRRELLYALKHAFNGALTPMVQCLLDAGELPEEELAGIEALIKAKRKREKK